MSLKKIDGRSKHKKTTEQFKKEVFDATKGEYEVLSEYISNNTYIELKHVKCGEIYETKPRTFTSGSRCPICRYISSAKKNSIKNKISHEKFVKNVEERHGKNEFTILSRYIEQKQKIKVRHNCDICENYEFEILPNNLYRYGCVSELHSKKKNEKSGFFEYKKKDVRDIRIKNLRAFSSKAIEDVPLEKRRIYSHEQLLIKLEAIGMKDYEILSVFKSGTSPITIKCKKCGTIQDKYLSQLYNKKHCTVCSINKRNQDKIIPFEEVIKRIDTQYSEGEYIPLSKYEDTRKHMLFKHSVCGYKWEIIPQNLMRGYSCPQCHSSRVSKGEKMIREILEKENICFKQEVSFDDLIVDRKLRYDFGIYNDKNELTSLIEYNGIQHYKEVEYFGDDKLQYRRRNDLLKIEYAKKINIPLIIIPYTYRTKKKIKYILKKNKIIN